IKVEDLQRANDHWTEMLNESEVGPVHSLIEMTEVEKYPTSVFQMGNSQTYLKHPKLGWVIGYGIKSSVANFIITTLTQVLQARIRVLESRVEAITYLRKVDPTLTDLT